MPAAYSRAICVSRPMGATMNDEKRHTSNSSAAMTIIVAPIGRLTQIAREYAAGNYQNRMDLQRKDEDVYKRQAQNRPSISAASLSDVSSSW